MPCTATSIKEWGQGLLRFFFPSVSWLSRGHSKAQGWLSPVSLRADSEQLFPCTGVAVAGHCLCLWCHTWTHPCCLWCWSVFLLEDPHSQLPENPWMEQLVMVQESKPQGTAWFPTKGIFPYYYSHSLISVFKICLCRILQNSFLVLDLFFQTTRDSVKTLRILVKLFISLKAGRLTGFSYA